MVQGTETATYGGRGHGYVSVGTLLEWIDAAGIAAATQWSGCRCVTAAMGNVHFDRLIRVGEHVDVRADVVYTGHSSMHALATVASAESTQTLQCASILVGVDQSGVPTEVPPWNPVTILELQRQRQARIRMRVRSQIENAMAAASYTADGTAPRTVLSFHPTAGDAGSVMRWIDDAAVACGADWAGTPVTTSYIAGISFRRPILPGRAVDVTARLIHTGPRSIHIGAHVYTGDHGTRHLAAQAVIVVSPDDRHDSSEVRQWRPETAEDHRLDQHARHLIGLRPFIEPFSGLRLTVA